MSGHLALPGFAHAEALFGLGQDDRRLAFDAARGVVGGVDLDHVVATALQAVDLFVAHALDQFGQRRTLAEKMFAVIGAVFRGERLELPVDRLRQGIDQ